MMPIKRVTVKLKHPNPLFEKWLTEWKEEAEAKDSKMQYCFSTALASLKKYPLPLEAGRDCKILKGFGDKLCVMLDEKLRRHRESEIQHSSRNRGTDERVSERKIDGGLPNNKINGKADVTESNEGSRKYTPQFRSGAYAILVCLYTSANRFLTKDEIVKGASPYCDGSFTKRDAGSYYTAWSSMRTLINKNLVTKEGNPAKYSLTGDGMSVVQKFYSDNLEVAADIPDISDLINKKIVDSTKERIEKVEIPVKKRKLTQKSSSSTVTEPAEIVIFEPHSFDIVLLVDTAETSGAKQAQDDPIVSDLLRLGTDFEIRHLKVGDYVWICRDRVAGSELVLPYVVERKRTDDFGQSIKDGRYHEQKFRLHQCGIRNVVYLVESYGKNAHTGLPMSTLMQAASNTLVQDGFQVRFSENSRSTAHYLNTLSRVIVKNYSGKQIVSCSRDKLESVSFEADLVPAMTFAEFSKSGSKHKKFTVKEMFIRHLLQLKGLSVDKALAIVEKYPTPKLLMDRYRENPEGAIKSVSSIVFGKGNKTIGPVISNVVHQLYATNF